MTTIEIRVLNSSTVALLVAVLALSLTPSDLSWPWDALWTFVAFAMVHATALITASILRRNAIRRGETPEAVRWAGPYFPSIPVLHLHALVVIAVALFSCLIAFSTDLVNAALRPSAERLLGTTDWFFFVVGFFVTLVAAMYLLASIVMAVFGFTRRRRAVKAAAAPK